MKNREWTATDNFFVFHFPNGGSVKADHFNPDTIFEFGAWPVKVSLFENVPAVDDPILVRQWDLKKS